MEFWWCLRIVLIFALDCSLLRAYSGVAHGLLVLEEIWHFPANEYTPLYAVYHSYSLLHSTVSKGR